MELEPAVRVTIPELTAVPVSPALSETLQTLGISITPPADPSQVVAVDTPLSLAPDQTGTLVRDFSEGYAAVIEVPRGALGSSNLSVAVSLSPGAESGLSAAVGVMGETFFNIVATDAAGNVVHSLDAPITITLVVPEALQGRDDLGVYWLDEQTNEWTLVPGTEFGKGTARFSVNHLTLFAIFSAPGLPSQISNTSRSVVITFLPKTKGATLFSLVVLFIAIAVIRRCLRPQGK
ncbi:MAG: hypothetical protein AAB538_06300, partial [Patescibacteria group bacterium]